MVAHGGWSRSARDGRLGRCSTRFVGEAWCYGDTVVDRTPNLGHRDGGSRVRGGTCLDQREKELTAWTVRWRCARHRSRGRNRRVTPLQAAQRPGSGRTEDVRAVENGGLQVEQ
ncbi:heat shock 70 kDa protein 15-like isoform X2 [Iris pallida]|uniref:Heat shock 70 kDa protein 15-like isoform X2 n=1 Tax=Iris pallida TaxID=29817 RepID=A0AAX6FN08_IRIPA|nr:heat shock 70 kDa protein 15-like isoform X2 [Iris pallida]